MGLVPRIKFREQYFFSQKFARPGWSNIDSSVLLFSREEVVGAVTTQRDRFESTHPAKLKAKECADLVLLSLYVYIPPSRGLEVRTLEIVKDRSTLDPKKSTDRNLLIMSDGGIRLQFNRYKTKRFRGRDELLIQVCPKNNFLLNLYLLTVSWPIEIPPNIAVSSQCHKGRQWTAN